MTVTHISEAEAARDFAAILTRVRAGEQVVIEVEAIPVAVFQPILKPEVRLLSKSLEILKERGSAVTLDGEFGRDLEDVVNSHREGLNLPAWD